MDYGQIALEKHAQWKGKIEVTARAAVDSAEALRRVMSSPEGGIQLR